VNAEGRPVTAQHDTRSVNGAEINQPKRGIAARLAKRGCAVFCRLLGRSGERFLVVVVLNAVVKIYTGSTH
jgi:hypothetical protein